MVDKVLYRIKDETLFRYVDKGGNIPVGDGTPIGKGWSNYKFVFTGVVGEIFMVTLGGIEGNLKRYVDTGTDDIGQGVVIGHSKWDESQSVFYGGSNLIYRIHKGHLIRYMVNGDADIGTGTPISTGGWQDANVIL
jgi:tachylectin